MKKIVFSFDIDGVLADTAPLAIKLFNKRFNSNKKVSDLKGFFIIYEWLKVLLNDDTKAMTEAVSIWNNDEVLSKSKPTKGAIEVVNELISTDHEIHFITSRPNYTKEITYNWLNKWFSGLKKTSIHMSANTNGLQRLFKAEMIGKIKPDVHFEDSIEHIADITKSSPTTKIVLVRQPWNSGQIRHLDQAVIIPEVRLRASLLNAYKYYIKVSK